jgi:hypothetical protein
MSIITEYLDCAECCKGCDRETDYIIYVCNINAAVDDNYTLYLNGKDMGNIILETNFCIGTFFRTNATIEPNNDLLEFLSWCCQELPPRGMTRQTLSEGDLKFGETNTLFMKNIKNNNNGNFGSVVVAGVYFDYEREVWVMCRRFLNTYYSGNSGESFRFDFELPSYE